MAYLLRRPGRIGRVTADLLARWCTLLDHPDGPAAGRDLLARWAEPHRRYHDVEHLRATLQRLEELSDEPAEADADAVRLAVFFHDAVYVATAGDNEERSAELAEDVLPALSVPAARVREVARLVRVTASHSPDPDDRAAALLCDADLGVLAGNPEEYAGYAAAVRSEYAQVPDDIFGPRRAEILGALLRRPHLYATATGRTLWEERARRNVTAELTLLRAGD